MSRYGGAGMARHSIACGIAAVVWILFHKITRLWWTYDDAYLIHLAVVHPALDHFFGGSLWHSMPQQLYTPLLTASYDAELSLFGADGSRFYAVHLIELMLAAVAIFAAMRMWLDNIRASFGALLFILGAPVVNVATELMLMHYIESIILGAIAVILFKREHWILSAIAYLAAMMAKEVAVPLIAVLLLLPRARWRQVIPHSIALAIYIALRWSALGTPFGGYGWVITASDVPRLLLLTPVRIFEVFLGPNELAGAVVLLVTAIVIIARWRWQYAVALALSIAPILPVAKQMQTRYALMAWLCWCVLAAISLQGKRLWFLWVIALAIYIPAWHHEYNAARRMSLEARAYFDLGENDLLEKPAIPPATMTELRWLKEDYSHRRRGAGWFYDDIYLCDTPLGARRVFEYAEKQRAVIQSTPNAGAFCTSIRSDVPLNVTFRYRGDALSWELGPYDDGKYTVVIADGQQAFVVPRREVFRMRGVDRLPVRVRYDSPSGWTTYSPPLVLDLSRDSQLTWHR